MRYILICLILVFSGCGAGNAEMIRWNAAGQKTEQVRTGWFYCLYWFGLDEPYLDYNNRFTVSAGRFAGQNDPNAPAVMIQALKSLDGLP